MNLKKLFKGLLQLEKDHLQDKGQILIKSNKKSL